MKQRTGFIAGGLLATALALSAAPALAGEASGSGQSGQSGQQQRKPVSDEKLEQFADAFEELRSVRAEYAPKLQETEDKEKRQELMKEGQAEMKDAIESSGMQVAEYQRIGQRLNQDQQLQQRLQKLMQERMGGSGAAPQGSSGQQ